MAVFRLLQPKSSLQICRLGFSIARERCCRSLPNSDDEDPPQLNKETAAEETSVVTVKPLPEESLEDKTGLFIRDDVTAFGGSNALLKLKALLFGWKKTTENEGKKDEGVMADILLNFSAYRNTQSEYLSHPCGPLQSEPASDSQDGNLKEFPPTECKKDLPECQKVRTGQGDNSSPINSIQKDLKDCHMKLANDRAAGKVDKPMRLTFTDQPFQSSNEPRTEDAEKFSDINGLIEFIRLPTEPFNSTNCGSKADKVKENSLDANFQRSDATNNKDQRRLDKTCFAGEESEENKVLVRFLRSYARHDQIVQEFSSCGEILNIEIPHTKGPLLKSGYIYFKTRDGLTKALEKSGSNICGGIISVVPATSTEKGTMKTPIPSLIADLDAPAALVKNPTRTIKIEQLTREISSRHIEKALAFCESNVSGYFLGSSESVAYVEFEAEIGKERALAKQSINVLGRHLVMLRIDSPRTTVVRISGYHRAAPWNILNLCRSLGDVRGHIMRTTNVLDVHFGFAEWPNMLKILNRLNGSEVDGKRIQAEPAPVFPPDVLLVLWQEPEERKHVKATALRLLHKFGANSLDTSQLASLQSMWM